MAQADETDDRDQLQQLLDDATEHADDVLLSATMFAAGALLGIELTAKIAVSAAVEMPVWVPMLWPIRVGLLLVVATGFGGLLLADADTGASSP